MPVRPSGHTTGIIHKPLVAPITIALPARFTKLTHWNRAEAWYGENRKVMRGFGFLIDRCWLRSPLRS
jgi:hypothetical protein